MNTNTSTQDPGNLFGADVLDANGNKIGTVDNVWVDDATTELEFVGVKTGWLFGKTHIIPCAEAQLGDGRIAVPYSEDQIKNAPSYGSDDELSPEDEQKVYSYYGLDRTTAPSPTGLATGETGTGSGSDTSDYATGAGTDGESLRLHEEELQVGTRQVEAGQVRLRKVVTSEREEVPVELEREEVEVERVPVNVSNVTPGGSSAFEEREIDVPVMREEAVVGKQARPTEEVRLNKNVQTQTETVGGDVRREDVEVDRDTGTGYSGTRGGTQYGIDDPEETTNTRF